MGRRGVDARRLSAQLHDRSVRRVPVLVQPAIGCHHQFPDRREVGGAVVHRRLHTGRVSCADDPSELITAHRSLLLRPGDPIAAAVSISFDGGVPSSSISFGTT